MICVAAAAVLTYTAFAPVGDPVDPARRSIDAAGTLAAGVGYWVLAPHFRVWMVHLIVVIGLMWGMSGLAEADSSLDAALLLITLLWTGVFVGAAFRPGIARIYAALICLGILAGMLLNGVPGGAGVGLAFAGSFVVIMEILSRATSQLRHEATTDPLTGLLNRAGLERELNRVRGFDRSTRISVLLADLDTLKQTNDRQGHRAGDRLLREFAATWRSGARAGDLVARIGGDEFVIVFPETDEDSARAAARRLREISPTLWSGGLVTSEPGESLESCLARADRLLYEEKAAKAPDAGSAGPASGAAVSSR